jgi:Na+-driven multidrug efflux pump
VLYPILAISIRTDGDPKLSAISSATVIVANLSLDILFMQGLGWGILGASASLCIAEALGMAVLLLHFGTKHALLRIQPSFPRFPDIKSFVVNGFGVGSAFVFQAIVMLVFNTLLLENGTGDGVVNVAIFGVIYTMSMIPFAVFDGAGNAISTVVSIFAGEKDCKSMLIVLRQGIKSVSSAGILITGIFLLSAEEVVRFFGLANTESSATAVLAFQVFSVSILFAGINSVVTAFWQSIGRARLASGMSVMRNFILMLVTGFALIARHQIIGLSVTYVCSEFVCLLGVILVLFLSDSKSYITLKYQSSNRIYENYYIIKTESIAHISSNLEELCEEWEIAPKQAIFINLIVEELILNIIKFGLKDSNKEHYIAIKLLDNQGEYILRIRDNVNTYNPFDLRGDNIDRAVIKLITEKTKYYDYQRKLIFNYLYLIV